MVKKMVYVNPWRCFVEEVEKVLTKAFEAAYPVFKGLRIQLEEPPSREYGDLSCSMCLSLARKVGVKPVDMAGEVLANLNLEDCVFIDRVVVSPPGYLNVYLRRSLMVSEAVHSALALGDRWGYVETDEPLKIVVEHTSVNPLHPITVGHARNSFLGDSLARILSARGHRVSRRFYVDDVGRQVALIAYAYKIVGDSLFKTGVKPDHAIGELYTAISALVEVRRLKEEVKRLRDSGKFDEARRVEYELSDWIGILSEIEKKNPELLEKLMKGMGSKDPETEVMKLLRNYEQGVEEAVKLVKPLVEKCLAGFKETLDRVSIEFDSWDWESDVVWSSMVRRVLDGLVKSGYVKFVGGVPEFEAGRAVDELGLREKLGIPKSFEIPSLTLLRRDGATLYTTRDIAYSIMKFRDADKVINVVGFDQTLPQIQVRVALYVLGYKEQAKKQVHFSYGLVKFPGFKMSSRRGRYVALDHLLDEAEARAYMEVTKISPHISEPERRRIARSVGVSAIKYSLLSVEPGKDVVFSWDRVLDFKRNSAPFILYAYARACGITAKASEKPEEYDLSLLKEPLEEELGLAIAKFPQVFVEASENLAPHTIASYCNGLATVFNSFYDRHPVLKAEERLRKARLALVEAFKTTMRNALRLIGIEPLQRM
ncbi:arginine--tRNA ligase [Candidatus Bathyarchaeota archaeon]|nr:arginine--tRNA ligase [Candidatus Bathyarchaeota archaeon]